MNNKGIEIDDKKMHKLMAIVPKLTKLIKEEVEKISLDAEERIILTHISDEMSLRAMGLTINEEYQR